MSRGKQTIRKVYEPDRKYGHILLGRFINKVMLNGKKNVAEKIVYEALDTAAAKLKEDQIKIFETALNNISPSVQLKARRVGGSNLQIPTEVSAERRTVLGLKWLVIAARGIKGKPMSQRLAQELIDAFNNAGNAVRKREETHRMAEANQAFAHFARF
ncbi:MAG: 30S ribosomal protein S7 [Patescibacteria group bacterium]